jgi:hypothetical protein
MRAVKAAPDGWMTCDLSFSRSSCGGPAPAVWALLVHDLHPDMQALAMRTGSHVRGQAQGSRRRGVLVLDVKFEALAGGVLACISLPACAQCRLYAKQDYSKHAQQALLSLEFQGPPVQAGPTCPKHGNMTCDMQRNSTG